MALARAAALDRVAVGEQHAGFVGVGFDTHRIGGQDIGSVEEIGDPAKALGFALCAVDAF